MQTAPAAQRLVSLGQFGERARPLRAQLNEAALIIGLGNVGLHAIGATREMLGTLLTNRDYQTNVRLLAIARRRSIREEAAVPRDERLGLEMDPINWSDVPGRYAHVGVAQWWPHSPRSRDAVEDLNQVRAYNRLLLFHNTALISEALYKLARWLVTAGTGREQSLPHRIYILTSLAEAEGSAMLFDIATRLRQLTRGAPTTIHGIFSLRALPNENDPENIQAMANVYASLREIDSYTLHPETFPSTLPVVGHSLERSHKQPALDLLLLTDDARTSLPEPPHTALAEAVTTWLANSLLPPDQQATLPQPIAVEPGNDRLSSYSTFGVSKLALPIQAAMNLAAVGLAQSALKALKNQQPTHNNPASWVNNMVSHARRVLIEADLLKSADVTERMRDWQYDMSAGGLMRQLENRANRGESDRMVDLILSEWRRLERESVGETSLEDSNVSTQPDSLRSRADQVLTINAREFYSELRGAPAQLGFAQGNGLMWVVSALEQLDQGLRQLIPTLNNLGREAEAAHKIAYDALMDAAQQFDGRSSGGRFGGRGKTNTAELDTHARGALHAVAGLIISQARRAAWEALINEVHDLADLVREAMPIVERSAKEQSDYEQAARRAMEVAAQQPPQFPAAVALTANWYQFGTQNLARMGQLPPHELLSQVYTAWGRQQELTPERQVRRFVIEIRDAARRALAGVFQFPDLYDFLAQNQNNPIYRQTLSALPNAATPRLVPQSDDGHGSPAAYELVREVQRPQGSPVPPAPSNVVRATLPSPDPDEITVLRVMHGAMAEALPPLREVYRRAYDRSGAEGVPLHIDRRWDSTMADLVHTTARREISLIWENLLNALRRNPNAVNPAMDALVRKLGAALDVKETQYHPTPSNDMRLITFKLRPFRLKVPPPVCPVLFIYSNRTTEELGEQVYQVVTPLLPQLDEQFAFVVNVNNRPDINAIIEPLTRVDFTILVLNEADIKHLIAARLPTRALTEMVLSQVSLTTVSPFYTRGPVPEHMFFGREREIAEVRSKLRTHSVALIGGRRIGKTSTLQRIKRQLEPRESEYVPYYLDCHGATDYRSFFYLIGRRWQVAVEANAAPVEFEDVVTVLQQRHPRKSIIMLFDEVDSLLRFDRRPENQETLFRTLRSLSNEKRCQYVFSGEKWLMRAIDNAYSALFNFTQAVRLEPLPPKVVRHLVADPFEMLNIWVERSEDVINHVYGLSAGHPNIVQLICQGMVEELDQDPDNTNLLNFDHLDRATSRRPLQEEIVKTIWGQMNPLAQLITLTWPEGTRFLTLRQIEDLLGAVGVNDIDPERLQRTAKDLELYCFVRPGEQDKLELIPRQFPAILDFMTDKARQIEIVRSQYAAYPDGAEEVTGPPDL